MDLAILALAAALTGGMGAGDTSAADNSGGNTEVFDRLTVVGDTDAPGSAHVIDLAQLETHDYNDVHRVLRQVPGVNVQEEEGFGLRPNIGIRGTGVERSQKITLMEDGVLIAPAPYAAPAAYYSPTAGRMQGMEIRKGTSAVRQGPRTTGGVINYQSTAIPGTLGGRAELGVGSDGLLRGHAHVGDSGERFGWLLEGYHLASDGFKDLDTGDDTGFDLSDVMGKFRVSSRTGARIYQTAELKLGLTRQDGNETYVGLTSDDFASTPYRRYAGSAADHIETEHEQIQLSYFAQLSPILDFTAVAYNNGFFRNWHKLGSVNGVGVGTLLDSPGLFPDRMAILTGSLDAGEALAVRNNRRDYYARGVEGHLGVHWGSRTTHDLEVGIRLHRDEEDRFQEDDLYDMTAGVPVLAALGRPGSNSNRVSSAEALALFVEDRIAFGNWTITPGARFEVIDLERLDYGKNDPDRLGAALKVTDNQVSKLVPGVGVQYRFDANHLLFAGVYKGFSPPTPGSKEEVEAEESDNVEAGWRYSSSSLAAEVTGFYTRYDNLLGTDTLSSGGGGTGEQFNGGAALVQGLETGLTWRWQPKASITVPLRAIYTFTDTEFRSSFLTSFADWAPAVEQGDKIPYVPEHQLTLGGGWTGRRWSMSMDGNYSAAMRTTAGQGAIEEGLSAVDGGIPAHWTWDLAVERTYGRYRLFTQIRNLTDETYLAARRPAGLRPGMPRTLVVGAKVDW